MEDVSYNHNDMKAYLYNGIMENTHARAEDNTFNYEYDEFWLK